MTSIFDPSRALELLRAGSANPTASFRDGQLEAIRTVCAQSSRVLVVQKTGWGKSFVYFIACKLLREAGRGPGLLISPLLALMRNQIAAAERMGLEADTVNSTNPNQWQDVEHQVRQGEIDLLLISPERLNAPDFVRGPLAQLNPSLVVIDEAHCISDWGHDFRPDYRRVGRLLRTLPNVSLLATTATASNRVLADLQRELGPDLILQRGDLHRPSLTLQSLRIPSQPARLAWLAHTLPSLRGSGIIYALTTRDTALVADWLQRCGIDARAYSGTLENGERERLETALLTNQCKALVATTALGMGYDKPDLGFVIHYQVPGSVVAYYQQVGRAGRALPSAYGVLLSGEEERAINDWFILSAFPSRDQVERLLLALEQGPEQGCTEAELLAQLNLPKGRLQQALKILSLESPAPIGKQGSRWQRLPAALAPGFWQRVERLTQLRQDEARQMQAYVDLSFGEHMAFLIAALDGDRSRVGPPSLPPLPVEVPAELVRKAASFLRQIRLPIEPRKQWPSGGLPLYRLNGRIPRDRQAEPGKALSFWSDAGWAELVKRGKEDSGRFDGALVEGCQRLIQQWRPTPPPAWVTCIPSRRHPERVPAFAAQLAAALGLPFVAALEKVRDTAEQKTMRNSTQQARNLDGSLAIAGPIPPGPCLLVDDLVDSRWTFTVAAWLLREHGAGPVFPLALAQTGQSD
ncbi:MAG: RecQ family ATP-dependent DNA helicase [Synechococcaceae cyanobacterium]|nr:RecQ family ATP-dependent DNA helicase [Synechococcaceae cyanobacterium]